MKTPPIPLSKESFAASLLAEYDLPPLLPDDITSARMAAQSIHRNHYWRRILEAKVDAGIMIRVKCVNPATRRQVTAYRPKPRA